MKEFIFVSDFDGTMTHKDFYHIVMDKYLDWGWDYYEEWKRDKAIDISFLNKIFTSINMREEDILEDILGIPFDDTVIPFMRRVKESGGDFIILSAGTSYYIDRLLEHKGIKDIKVISNYGVYKEGGIHLVPDEKSSYYSKAFGIDKGRATLELRGQYRKLYFAGDSRPDLEAALIADVAFAKGGLPELLREKNHPFVPFESFSEIERYMIEGGILCENPKQ